MPLNTYSALDFIEFMINAGWNLKNHDCQNIIAYFDSMILRERVVAIREQGQLRAFCTFALVSRWSKVRDLYHLPMWEVPYGDPEGDICYIDKLVAQVWTLGLRKQLQELITWRYPRIEWAVWYRARPGDLPDRSVIRKIQEGRYAKV